MNCEPEASSIRTWWLTVVAEKSFIWLFTAPPRYTGRPVGSKPPPAEKFSAIQSAERLERSSLFGKPDATTGVRLWNTKQGQPALRGLIRHVAPMWQPHKIQPIGVER